MENIFLCSINIILFAYLSSLPVLKLNFLFYCKIIRLSNIFQIAPSEMWNLRIFPSVL